MWGLRRALAPRTDLAGALLEFCCDPDDFIHSPEPDTRTTTWERWLLATRDHGSAAGLMVTRYLREAAAPGSSSSLDDDNEAAMPVYLRPLAAGRSMGADRIAAQYGADRDEQCQD